jgi:hypothetical protein
MWFIEGEILYWCSGFQICRLLCQSLQAGLCMHRLGSREVDKKCGILKTFIINFMKVTIDSEVEWIGRYREKLVTSHFFSFRI